MDPYERGEHHQPAAGERAGRIKRLYDRLAAILRGLPPDRLEAFHDHLQDTEASDDADDHRGPEAGD